MKGSLLFRMGPSKLIRWAILLTRSMWDDQVCRLSTVTPRKRVLSSHLIGSPKGVSGWVWMNRRTDRAKMIAELLDTFIAILHSFSHR